MARGLLEGWAELIPNSEGTEFKLRQARFNLAMDCENPYTYEVFARTPRGRPRDFRWAIVHSRCRRCGMCKSTHGRFWAARAVTEFNRWPRTLLGTFTMSIETHEMFDLWIETGVGGRPRENLNLLTDQERFTARCRVIGDEITLYLKRIRKQLRTSFRYLLIAEAHDSEATDDRLRGRPHYHILLHEKKVGTLVRGDPREAMPWRYGHLPGYEWELRNVKTRSGWKPKCFATDDSVLRQEWTHGFTKYQLAESANSAVYPCKYLTKAIKFRVRNSNCYGGEGEQVPIGIGEVPPNPERSEAALAETTTTTTTPSQAQRSGSRPQGMGPISSEERSDGLRNGGTPRTASGVVRGTDNGSS
jgi:hypothetical protein